MAVTRFRSHAAACVAGAALAAPSVTATPPAHADDLWGACAVPANPQLSENAICLANGYPTQAEAQSQATDTCNSVQQNECRVVVSYTDCGAVAQSGDRWQGGSGPTQQAAEQAATRITGGGFTLQRPPVSTFTVKKSACVARG